MVERGMVSSLCPPLITDHSHVSQGAEKESLPVSLPPLKVSDIPPDQVELIIARMTEGGYGDYPTILKSV